MLGLSPDSPISVSTVSEEYEYLAKEYPESQVLSQALNIHGDEALDCIHIQLVDGTTKRVYFNISNILTHEAENLQENHHSLSDPASSVAQHKTERGETRHHSVFDSVFSVTVLLCFCISISSGLVAHWGVFPSIHRTIFPTIALLAWGMAAEEMVTGRFSALTSLETYGIAEFQKFLPIWLIPPAVFLTLCHYF